MTASTMLEQLWRPTARCSNLHTVKRDVVAVSLGWKWVICIKIRVRNASGIPSWKLGIPDVCEFQVQILKRATVILFHFFFSFPYLSVGRRVSLVRQPISAYPSNSTERPT